MDSQTRDGKALPYILVTPAGVSLPAPEYPLVILMHGFGASMYDLAGLASAIESEGYVYAFPNAPYRVPFGMGQAGYSWMMRNGVEPPPPGMPELPALLDTFFDEVVQETGALAGNMVLGGFSQGASMTLRYGLARAGAFRGLVVLSGFPRDLDEVRSTLPEPRDQRIFIAHGLYDQTVPIERGRETKAFLEAEGFTPRYQEYEMGHEIPLSVIRDLIPWLHETLPPRTA